MSGAASPGNEVTETQAAAIYLRTLLLRDYLDVAIHFQQREIHYTPAALSYHADAVSHAKMHAEHWATQCKKLGWQETAHICGLIANASSSIDPGRKVDVEYGAMLVNRRGTHCETALNESLPPLQQALMETEHVLDLLKQRFPALDDALLHMDTAQPAWPVVEGYAMVNKTLDDFRHLTQSTAMDKPGIYDHSRVQLGYAVLLEFMERMMRNPLTSQDYYYEKIVSTLETVALATRQPLNDDIITLQKTLKRLFPALPTLEALRTYAAEEFTTRDISALRRNSFLARPDDSATVRYLHGAVAAEKGMAG